MLMRLKLFLTKSCQHSIQISNNSSSVQYWDNRHTCLVQTISISTKRMDTDTDVVVAYCVNVIKIVKLLEELDDKQVVDALSAKAKWCLSKDSKSNWDQVYYACSLHLLNTARRSMLDGKAEMQELLEMKKRQEIEECQQEEEEKKKAKAQKTANKQEGTRKVTIYCFRH